MKIRFGLNRDLKLKQHTNYKHTLTHRSHTDHTHIPYSLIKSDFKTTNYKKINNNKSFIYFWLPYLVATVQRSHSLLPTSVWCPAVAMSGAPSHRTARIRPLSYCVPSISLFCATWPVGSGTTPEGR